MGWTFAWLNRGKDSVEDADHKQVALYFHPSKDIDYMKRIHHFLSMKGSKNDLMAKNRARREECKKLMIRREDPYSSWNSNYRRLAATPVAIPALAEPALALSGPAAG